MRRTVATLMLALLLTGMLTLAFDVQRVKACGTIYVRADGSIDPVTAPISTVDNVTYTFTGNVNDSIVVERDNIVVDGAGYTLQCDGSGTGISLSYRSNVEVKNIGIDAFYYGIRLWASSNNTISENNITNNYHGILLDYSSDYNTISGNNVTANCHDGIGLSYYSNYNKISDNSITKNHQCWNTICYNSEDGFYIQTHVSLRKVIVFSSYLRVTSRKKGI